MTQSQSMIYEAFENTSIVPNQMDIQNTPLYDTITIAAGAALNTLTSALFTNVGPASGKTLAQTNMTQQNRLPAPQAFSIFSFRNRWAEDILLADLLNILNGFAFEFTMGEKDYQRAPIWFYAAGGGISGMTTINNSSVYTNGLPSREAMQKLAIPLVIQNQDTFSAQFQGNALVLTAAAAGGTGLTYVSLLDGLYARGVR